ncbi:MAG: sensor histidine kinase [Anaerocolumna sp.]
MKKQIFQAPVVETNTIEVLSNHLFSITKELTLANQELERTGRERNTLLSNISHDLRAPISAIRSAVDLLLSGQTLGKDDIDNAINLIDRRTFTLQTMIQDLYLLLTLENNELSFQYKTISAGPFFEEYFYNVLVDERYQDKNMCLELSEDLNVRFTIDIQQMIRVMDNLFTNAAKYSLQNANITLSIRPNQESTHLIIKVIDTGIGIPDDCIAKIFDRTYTVSSARTPDSPTGSGLGLSIVKTIVEKFHGQVSCNSHINEGSTFTIVLPIAD